MEFYAFSPAFDGIYVLVHETGSDNDFYGEGVANDKRHVKQRVAEASPKERHAEKS